MANSTPTVQLNLDEMVEDESSLIESCIKEGVEEEKCLVSQYRTTLDQKLLFQEHIKQHPANRIPIEWVIDIADEANGWFYGTAYHYDDTKNLLHVMVPDKHNPTFDGEVLLDHRTVHLIECVDKESHALFNKIVRNSIVKVKWDIEWLEEDSDQVWVPSCARYFIRIANQVLVEDQDSKDGPKGYVMLTADLNFKLIRCHKGKGMDDFERLISENIVLYSSEARDQLDSHEFGSPVPRRERVEQPTPSTPHEGGSGANTLKKLAELSRNLRDVAEDLLQDRDSTRKDMTDLAGSFRRFALEGDLDSGLSLVERVEEIETKAKQLDQQKEDDPDGSDPLGNDLWYLACKVEKTAHRALRSHTDNGTGAEDEIENLKKQLKRMKRELEDKDREIQDLHSRR